MSNLVTLGRVSRNRARAVNSPQTLHEDPHVQFAGHVGNPNVTMKATDQQSAARNEPVINRNRDSDSRPAFAVWWERWREARNHISPTSIKRHF